MEVGEFFASGEALEIPFARYGHALVPVPASRRGRSEYPRKAVLPLKKRGKHMTVMSRKTGSANRIMVTLWLIYLIHPFQKVGELSHDGLNIRRGISPVDDLVNAGNQTLEVFIERMVP